MIKCWPEKPELLLIHQKYIFQPCIFTRRCSSVCTAALFIQYFFIWLKVRICKLLLKVTKGRRALIDRTSPKALFPQYTVSARNEGMSQFAWKLSTWLSNKYDCRVKAFLSVWLVRPPTAAKIRFLEGLFPLAAIAWVRNTMVSQLDSNYTLFPELTLWFSLAHSCLKVDCNS